MTGTPSINLAPPSYARRRAAIRSGRRWAFGHTVLLVVGVVMILGGRARIGSDVGALRAQADKLGVSIAAMESELAQLNARKAEADRRSGLTSRLSKRADWGVLLAYLERSLGDGLSIESARLTGDNSSIRLAVTALAEAQGREWEILAGLQGAGVFDTVSLLGSERVRVAGGERVRISVEATVGGTTPGEGDAP